VVAGQVRFQLQSGRWEDTPEIFDGERTNAITFVEHLAFGECAIFETKPHQTLFEG
jgi:hypothetical protein